MSFSSDDEIFVVSGKHNFSFDILSRHGKSSSYLYTDYIDLDTAAGTMYVFKEKQNEKKLYLICVAKAPVLRCNIGTFTVQNSRFGETKK